MYYSGPEIQTPTQAVIGDVALMAVLLLFNQGKILEHYLFRIFPYEATRENTKRFPTTKGKILVAAVIVIYTACIFTLLLEACHQRS